MRRNMKLNSAITSSRKLLPKRDDVDSPSRLARKLGIERTEKSRITLLQRTSSDKRTTYGRISEKILIVEIGVECHTSQSSGKALVG